MRHLILLILVSSCGPLKFVGNPEPDMKTVHMVTSHWGYTQEEKDAHPDYDCITYKTREDYESNNRRKQYRR